MVNDVQLQAARGLLPILHTKEHKQISNLSDSFWPESANSIWALPAYSGLNFSLLSHLQGIIDLDAKISDRAILKDFPPGVKAKTQTGY